MSNEPVLIVMDGEYLVHCGHPDKFDKDLLALYMQDGYNIQTITLQKFKEIDWKWVWSKEVIESPTITCRSRYEHLDDMYVSVLRKKEAIKPGDIVFHARGYVGIVAATDYNDMDEVEVDWIGRWSSIWLVGTNPASRTSIQYIDMIKRPVKLHDHESSFM